MILPRQHLYAKINSYMLMLLHKLQKEITFLYTLYVRKITPVVIFTPGRVGSMALHACLLKAGVFVFKLEFLDIGNSGAAHFIIKHVFKKQRQARIITIVRDPVTMMITYFFSKASAGHLAEAHDAWKNKDVAKLQTLFIRDILMSERLDSHLYWYERDFFRATKIDVFAYPFDTEKKSTIISHDLYPILILRTEMDDEVKSSLVSQFLSISPFTLTRENTRSEKADKELYEVFKRTLSVPPPLLEKIYTAKLCQHFFSTDELEKLKLQWASPQ